MGGRIARSDRCGQLLELGPENDGSHVLGAGSHVLGWGEDWIHSGGSSWSLRRSLDYL